LKRTLGRFYATLDLESRTLPPQNATLTRRSTLYGGCTVCGEGVAFLRREPGFWHRERSADSWSPRFPGRAERLDAQHGGLCSSGGAALKPCRTPPLPRHPRPPRSPTTTVDLPRLITRPASSADYPRITDEELSFLGFRPFSRGMDGGAFTWERCPCTTSSVRICPMDDRGCLSRSQRDTATVSSSVANESAADVTVRRSPAIAGGSGRV